jgi:hypothetical protein
MAFTGTYTSPGVYKPPGSYNVNPSPQAGQGAYGKVPGPIGLPPSLYQQATGMVPGLASDVGSAASTIGSELTGAISPEWMKQIQHNNAAFGVNSGVPGSPFQTGNLLESLNLAPEQIIGAGMSHLSSLLGQVGGLQLDPGLQSQIGSRNAALASAPDPQAAAAQMLHDFQTGIGYGGPAGGTGAYAGPHTLAPAPSYAGGLPGGSPTMTGGFSPTWYSPNNPSPVFGPQDGATPPDQEDWYTRTFGTKNPVFGTDPMAAGYDSSGAYYDPFYGE